MPHYDFDAYAAEVRKEPITFTCHGEAYEVPGDIPFFTKLRLATLLGEKGAVSELSVSELYELLTTIFGAENARRLEASGANDAEVVMLLNYISNAYSQNAQPSARQKATTEGAASPKAHTAKRNARGAKA